MSKGKTMAEVQDQSPMSDEEGVGLLDVALAMSENRRLLILGPVLAGLIALAATFAITPTFVAKTVFLPPQQQQISAAAAAMQSLGALAGMAGNAIKNPADQYVSFMQSATVANRIIDVFKLKDVYELSTLEETRKKLASHVRIEANKKDGLISVEVEDADPKRAAAIANNYVDQLRKLTAEFVITEAQQRRALFERQLQYTRNNLTTAQKALQESGITEGALRAEPRAAADAYAALKAQVTATEIRLQSMRNYLTEQAPEFKLAQSNLTALRSELRKAEESDHSVASDDYIGKYREFKYQEALFELFAKQFELARLDETREGGAVQVVDAATPPEKKSKPRRGFVVQTATGVTFTVLLAFVLGRQSFRAKLTDARVARKLARLKRSWAR